MPDCPFCTPPDTQSNVARFQNELAYVREDKFPVSTGHLLIVSRRHAQNWFDLSDEEQAAIMALLNQARNWLAESYRPAGYNIGINCGEAAGQTVMHMHCHLIPRYDGDVADPRGGVRGVVPGKQKYMGIDRDT